MNSKKIFRIVIECMWIAMALVCLGVAIFYQVRIGEQAQMYYFMLYGLAIVSFGMFAVRFVQRRNEEKREQRRTGK